jgi:hypothetical protein
MPWFCLAPLRSLVIDNECRVSLHIHVNLAPTSRSAHFFQTRILISCCKKMKRSEVCLIQSQRWSGHMERAPNRVVMGWRDLCLTNKFWHICFRPSSQPDLRYRERKRRLSESPLATLDVGQEAFESEHHYSTACFPSSRRKEAKNT